jgi:hypothetical protein
MGWVGAAVAIASAAYGAKVSQDNAYNAAVRQNEMIQRQYDAEQQQHKARQDELAVRAREQNKASAAAAAGDEELRRKAAASASEESEAGETLLTGSSGVKNALRKKSTIGGY